MGASVGTAHGLDAGPVSCPRIHTSYSPTPERSTGQGGWLCRTSLRFLLLHNHGPYGRARDTLEDGQTYDKEALDEWFLMNVPCTSPNTGKVLASKTYIPNRALKNAITHYKQEHKIT